MVCAVIFNYYYYEEFCVSGDVHGSFFITITSASFVVSGGACVYFLISSNVFQLLLLPRLFCCFGWCALLCF